MRKLGVSIIGGHPDKYSTIDQIKLFAEVGFDCFFTGASGSRGNEPVEEWAECAAKYGIEFETIHAPFGGVNDLWKDIPAGDDYMNYMCTVIDQCHRANVDKMIMQVTIGNTAPDVGPVGLNRFAKLEEYAEKNGVHLCYENLEPLPHLHDVMKHANPYHGFCLDIGHNSCYTPHIPMMQLYGDRILCTHIHDNRGVTQPGNIDYRDDNHLLPFDGILDWKWFAKTLNATGYTGPMTFELSAGSKPEYKSGTFVSFVRDAFERAKRVRAFEEE